MHSVVAPARLAGDGPDMWPGERDRPPSCAGCRRPGDLEPRRRSVPGPRAGRRARRRADHTGAASVGDASAVTHPRSRAASRYRSGTVAAGIGGCGGSPARSGRARPLGAPCARPGLVLRARKPTTPGRCPRSPPLTRALNRVNARTGAVRGETARGPAAHPGTGSRPRGTVARPGAGDPASRRGDRVCLGPTPHPSRAGRSRAQGVRGP